MLTIHVEFPVVSGVDSLLPHFEDMVRLAKHLNVHVQAEWRDFEVHAWPDSVAEFMLNSLKEDAKLEEAMRRECAAIARGVRPNEYQKGS